MLVVFYTVKILYSCVCMKCSTSYSIGDALTNQLNLSCMILLSHNGYLGVFCIATGIKHHDIYLLQCCLIRLYVVLNPERFFLHVYVIPSIAFFDTSASWRNALPILHIARTH